MKKYILGFIVTLMGTLVFANDTILPYPIDTVKGTAVYRYIPEKSIGLYRISVKFGLPMGEIVQWNPVLAERGPQLADTLLIPVKQTIWPVAPQPVRQEEKVVTADTKPVDVAPAVPVQPIKEESLSQLQEAKSESAEKTQDVVAEEVKEQPRQTPKEAISESPSADQVPAAAEQTVVSEPMVVPAIEEDSGSVIRIAVMLPLQAQALTRDANDDRFYDFYAGVLLAIREAQDKGQRFEIHTYDVSRNDRQMTDVLSDSFLLTAQAIIGPVYAQQIELVARHTLPSSPLIVAPFSSQISCLADYPNILQFNPTSAMEAEVMAAYLAARKDSVRCLVMDVQDVEMQQGIRLLKQQLQQEQIPLTRVPLQAILADSLGMYLQDSVENVFIFHKDKYSNLKILRQQLLAAAAAHPVTLFSHYMWQKENIGLPQIYTSIFEVVQDSTDHSPMAAYQQDFEHYFSHTLSSTLPRYDLLGYDLTAHLVGLLQQLQDSADEVYSHSVLTKMYHGLQSDIQYQRQEQGGYINSAIHVVRR